MSVFRIFNESFDDLVFENRNKNYGAYHLRKVQDVFMVRGMMVSISFLLAFIFGPRLFSSLDLGKESEIVCDRSHEVNLENLPIVEPKKMPPPKAELPRPSKPAIRFVEPTIVRDDLRIEELPPTIIEIGNNEISKATMDGSPNGIDIALIPNEGDGEIPPVVDKPIVTKPNEPSIYEFTAEKPSFPDGQIALMKYLSKNINYPSIARETGIEGRVIVQFVVSKYGYIEMVKVVRGIGGGCDEEALRVVNQMPKWLPGRNNDQAVNVRFTLPITFKLQ